MKAFTTSVIAAAVLLSGCSDSQQNTATAELIDTMEYRVSKRQERLPFEIRETIKYHTTRQYPNQGMLADYIFTPDWAIDVNYGGRVQPAGIVNLKLVFQQDKGIEEVCYRFAAIYTEKTETFNDFKAIYQPNCEEFSESIVKWQEKMIAIKA